MDTKNIIDTLNKAHNNNGSDGVIEAVRKIGMAQCLEAAVGDGLLMEILSSVAKI